MTLERSIHALLEHELEFRADEFQDGGRAKQAETARQEIKRHIAALSTSGRRKRLPPERTNGVPAHYCAPLAP